MLQKAEISLNELAQTSRRLGVVISGAGLDQRIDAEGVRLLQEVLQECLQYLNGQERLEIGLLARFSAVYLTDSTQMELPAAMAECFPGSGGHASPAAIKLQVMFEYLTSSFRAIELGPANQPDQNCRVHLAHSQKGALHLFDLGYFNQRVLDSIHRREAYFITRLDHRVALFNEEDQSVRLQLLQLLREMKGDQLEMPVRMGIEVMLPVRVLFQRLPPNIVAERRRNAIRRMRAKGRTPTAEYLELLEWNFFITNIPQDWLSFDQILLLDHVRWQVELVFKLWKSQAGLDRLGSWRKERLLVQIYARLIGLAIFYALSAPYRWAFNRELSLPKAFSSFQAVIPSLIRVIRKGWRAFPSLLKYLTVHWRRFDLKTHRRKSPSTLQLLLNAA